MAIVEAKVRPEREEALAKSWSKDKEKRSRNWWLFSRTAKDLYEAIAGMDRVLVCSRVSTYNSFVFLPATWIFAETTNVFAFPGAEVFAVLQSRAHEVWARFFSSSMKDDLRYSPTDCFETFPFPLDCQADKLEHIGERYYEYRADLMSRTGKGLTDTYNRFHSKLEGEPDILKLRALHNEMDRAVLDAYGWKDLQPRLDFILDYEDEEDDGSPSNDRKKPWRYRWIDEDRDEVLARLLELNNTRAKGEPPSDALHAAKGRDKSGGKSPKKMAPSNPSLFET
jgi:hypothetical protein